MISAPSSYGQQVRDQDFWADARAERAAFLDSILPATAEDGAYVVIPKGYGGHLNAKGRFEFAGGWVDSFYDWPSEKDALLSDLDKLDALVGCGEKIDIYQVPALRHGTIPTKTGGQRPHRRNTNALPTATVWADLDGPVIDQALYDQLAPTAVVSGSVTEDGQPRQHVYVPLSRPVSVPELEALNKALAKALAGDGGDSKHANNSLLRMPGGLNHKRGNRVRLLRLADALTEPETLAALLGVDLVQAREAAERRHVAAIELADDVPMPEGLPKAVTWALTAALPTTPSGQPDRSKAVHRLVGACLESGLDLGVATRITFGYGPAETFAGRIPAEVARSWSKLLPEVERRRELAEKWLADQGDAEDEPCSFIAAQIDKAQAGGLGTLAARVGTVMWMANSKSRCPGARRVLNALRMLAVDALFDEDAADQLIGRALGSRGVADELAKPRARRCEHRSTVDTKPAPADIDRVRPEPAKPEATAALDSTGERPQSDQEDEDDGAPRTGWERTDLAAFLDGTHERPQAEILYRTDGQGLFYRGRVHWVMGEPESGKSWLALVAAARVLADGGRVLYLDYESEPAEIITRLRALGVEPAAILAGFDYRNPESGPESAREQFAALCREAFDLVVIDGVTDALGTSGAKLLDNDEVSAWIRKVPARLGKHTGGAVVCIDHVTKGSGTGGTSGNRFALGAQAKLARVSGTSYLVEPKAVLAPGRKGEMLVWLGKDRGGSVRAACPPPPKAGERVQLAAKLVIDATDPDTLTAEVQPPPTALAPTNPEARAAFRPTAIMERLSIAFEKAEHTQPGGALSSNTAALKVGGRKQNALLALERLVDEGYVKRTEKGSGFVNKLVKPYRQAADPRADIETDEAREAV